MSVPSSDSNRMAPVGGPGTDVAAEPARAEVTSSFGRGRRAVRQCTRSGNAFLDTLRRGMDRRSGKDCVCAANRCADPRGTRLQALLVAPQPMQMRNVSGEHQATDTLHVSARPLLCVRRASSARRRPTLTTRDTPAGPPPSAGGGVGARDKSMNSPPLPL